MPSLFTSCILIAVSLAVLLTVWLTNAADADKLAPDEWIREEIEDLSPAHRPAFTAELAMQGRQAPLTYSQVRATRDLVIERGACCARGRPGRGWGRLLSRMTIGC